MTNPLPEYCVDVVEPGVPHETYRVRCEIGKNLKFDTETLEAYCLSDWDVRVYDAFVLAAAVQFCDHAKRRPSTAWGRDFSLRIPVHDPERWRSADVSTPLHDALALLTGDRWNINFLRRKESFIVCRQKHFSMPGRSSVIVPFSDGLDSYAVAGLMNKKYGQKIVRVRLGSSPLSSDRDKGRRLPFASVPYRVSFGDQRSVESSSRSRGFRFALLSGIASYLCRARKILLPESGQGTLGTALVVVGQSHPDYRGHPRFTDLMEAFIAALFDHEVHYVSPRMFHTKGETLREFFDTFPDDSGWEETRSCWQGARQVSVSGRLRQCGVCAACLLRRMSIHSCGRSESREAYVWEDLSVTSFEGGANPAFKHRLANGALYEYAIAGTLYLDHLADILHSAANRTTLDRHTLLLSRSRGFSEEGIRAKLERMLRRHRREWKSFIDSLGSQSFLARWVTGA